MVTGEYHMVISDRVAEEIIPAYIFFGHVEHNLCAAQVLFAQIVSEAGLACEMARQVSRNFEYGHVSCRQAAADGHSDAGLEMGVEAVSAYHIQRNGAVCDYNLTALRVDA